MEGGGLRLMSDKGCLPGRERIRANYGRLDFLYKIPPEEAGQGEVGLQTAGPGHRVLDGAEVDGLAVIRVLAGPHADLLGQFLGGEAARIHLGHQPRCDAAPTAQKLGFAFQDVQAFPGH
jgi:hypothetical protein